AVMVERVECTFGGGDGLDAEALEERTRPELRPGELLPDVVVERVGVVRRQRLGAAEYRRHGVIDPELRGRAREEMIVPREDPPRLARICRFAARLRQPERIVRDAGAVEHAEEI